MQNGNIFEQRQDQGRELPEKRADVHDVRGMRRQLLAQRMPCEWIGALQRHLRKIRAPMARAVGKQGVSRYHLG